MGIIDLGRVGRVELTTSKGKPLFKNKRWNWLAEAAEGSFWFGLCYFMAAVLLCLPFLPDWLLMLAFSLFIAGVVCFVGGTVLAVICLQFGLSTESTSKGERK